MVSSVWFYVPNIIGYSRILFAIMAFYNIDSFKQFFIYYSLSAVLDIADGHAARALNQCSKFGAILDMVTDRASTTCLIVVLSQYYPTALHWFLFLIALDIVSHFAHIWSSLSRGSSSHKNLPTNSNPLLKIYYTNRLVLGGLCWGNETFFVLLYLLHHWAGPLVPIGPLGQVLRSFFEVQGNSVSFVRLCIAAVFPLMAYKQLMNLIQLWQASKDIVALDELEKTKKK